MYTIEEVKDIINSLPIEDLYKKQVVGKSENKELPNIIRDYETIKDIVSGFYASHSGILVATDKRLIFVCKGLMWGLTVEDFPFDKISSIQYELGMLTAELIIFSSGNEAKIKNVANERCRLFCENVRAIISSPRKNESEGKQVMSNSNNDDMIEQLERLSKLKEVGALTDEEFKAAKKKLLNL